MAGGAGAIDGADAAAGRLLQAERSLRASELRLRQVLDESKAVVFWKDLHGRYLFVNREFCRLVGKLPEQVIGRSDRDGGRPNSDPIRLPNLISTRWRWR